MTGVGRERERRWRRETKRKTGGATATRMASEGGRRRTPVSATSGTKQSRALPFHARHHFYRHESIGSIDVDREYLKNRKETEREVQGTQGLNKNC